MPVIEVEFRRQPSIRMGPVPASADCVDDASWPTTQRFSRRSGDNMRGADYSAAIERPCQSVVAARAVVITVAVALLGAVAIVLGHAE